MSQKQIVVKRYKSQRRYERDAARMAEKGYKVQSVASQQPRAGLGRIFLLGFFALLFKPKPILVVTYELAPKAATVPA